MDAGAISAYTDFIKTQNTADAKLKENKKHGSAVFF